MADVRSITNAAARWLIDNPRSGQIEADDPKLLAYVVAQTGQSESKVFDILVDHWPTVRHQAAASSAEHKSASGGVGARLRAAGHESPPVPGITIRPIDDTSWIDERILFRSAATDHKGRAYGTSRNPGVPPLEKFNPRFWDVRAGDLEGLIKERKHGRFEEQRRSIAGLDDRALLQLRTDDPMSARWTEGGLSLTGGHHRTWEIIDRVREGRMSPDTVVRILVHE